MSSKRGTVLLLLLLGLRIVLPRTGERTESMETVERVAHGEAGKRAPKSLRARNGGEGKHELYRLPTVSHTTNGELKGA